MSIGRLVDVVDRADIRVLKRRGSLGLSNKALYRFVVACEVRRKEFECNSALQAGVFGFVDHTHAAFTKLFEDPVVRNGLANHDANVPND
jgi:hypothetical protein